jgi:flagellar basal body-associated protein FliL
VKVEKAKRTSGGGSKGAVILLIVIAVIAVLSLLVNFITDWMWFSEMGYVSVFLKKISTELIIGVPLFAVLVILIDLYLHRLKKNYFNKIVSNEVTDEKRLSVYTRIVVAIFSLIIAVYTATHLWFGSLQYSHATKVKLKDPVFHLDISFYLFKLDFLKQLNEILIVVILLVILMSIIYYVILLSVHSPEVFERDYTAQQQQNSGNVFYTFANGFMNGGQRPQPKRMDRKNLSGLLSVASGQLTVLCVIFFLMLGSHSSCVSSICCIHIPELFTEPGSRTSISDSGCSAS